MSLQRNRRYYNAIITPPNFKWPEDPLNMVQIKNPFGFLQTNPKADAWWVPPFFLLKKCFCETMTSDNWYYFQPAGLHKAFQSLHKDLKWMGQKILKRIIKGTDLNEATCLLSATTHLDLKPHSCHWQQETKSLVVGPTKEWFITENTVLNWIKWLKFW